MCFEIFVDLEFIGIVFGFFGWECVIGVDYFVVVCDVGMWVEE